MDKEIKQYLTQLIEAHLANDKVAQESAFKQYILAKTKTILSESDEECEDDMDKDEKKSEDDEDDEDKKDKDEKKSEEKKSEKEDKKSKKD